MRKVVELKTEQGRVWLYRALAAFTIFYVTLQLIVFFSGLEDMPVEVSHFWMWSLVGYVVLKEASRWANVELSAKAGEVFAILVIGAFLLMVVINLVRQWVFALPYLEFPQGYFESTVEALVLLIASAISSLLYVHQGRKS